MSFLLGFLLGVIFVGVWIVHSSRYDVMNNYKNVLKFIGDIEDRLVEIETRLSIIEDTGKARKA